MATLHKTFNFISIPGLQKLVQLYFFGTLKVKSTRAYFKQHSLKKCNSNIFNYFMPTLTIYWESFLHIVANNLRCFCSIYNFKNSFYSPALLQSAAVDLIISLLFHKHLQTTHFFFYLKWALHKPNTPLSEEKMYTLQYLLYWMQK